MARYSRKKVIEELEKAFPRMQKHDEIVDVLFAGEHIRAYNESNRAKKWKFVLKGASSNAFYRAYKYKLLEKRESARRAFVMSLRGINTKNKKDTYEALKKERVGLLKHLAVSASARRSAAKALSLTSDSYGLIKQELEQGDSQTQLTTYGKVVNRLTVEKKYNKKYDYYWMGFRNIGDLYWLSDMARRILTKAVV
ncbi:hypothetical protein [Nitrosopumilus sp.]|uniref:hypothetical protein n=1 Tax=Nitrosopumilus sp. TaxID=2024843 RepID=UPI003D127468